MELISLNQHYRMGIASSLREIGSAAWDQLLASDPAANPFLSSAFLDALHESGSACQASGWTPCFLTLWQQDRLVAACPLYEKNHSSGEYVFDWAWADAYQRYGHEYYPKLLSAIPFTPVSGCRIIAAHADDKRMLISVLRQVLAEQGYSSCHALFLPEDEVALFAQAGFLIRTGVQFHWNNPGYRDFEEFLATLEQKKRKNIRAERRKVAERGIVFSHVSGSQASADDWRFFKQCYDLTYTNHRARPYLNLDFFLRIGASMPQHIHLIFAVRDGEKIAASLLIHHQQRVYGRYWGCIEQHPCLHFETAYYQAIEFCIREKISVFEGGAQGEHKMARGFLPFKTWSAHSLALPEFNDAVANFLNRERQGIEMYLDDLNEHSPYQQAPQAT